MCKSEPTNPTHTKFVICDHTISSDFPITLGGTYQQSFGGGTFDGFVAKLSLTTILSFTTQPGGVAVAGSPFSVQPVVTVQNLDGSTQVGYTGPISVTIARGTGTVGAVLTGTTTVNAVGGVATFTNLSIDTAGSNYVLMAMSNLYGPVYSQPFTVSATSGAASIVATGGTPQSTIINTNFGSFLKATVRTASGLPVSGASVVFLAYTSGAGGTFVGSGATFTAITNGSGVATAPIFTANGTTGTYTVTATTSGVITPASFSLTNTPAPVGPILTLAPIASGPNPISSTVILTATLVDRNRQALGGQIVTFTVSGPNATIKTATTNSSGIAVITYTGTVTGTDTVQAIGNVSGLQINSNLAIVYWQAVQISTSSVFGRFYTNPDDRAGAYFALDGTQVFSQSFPGINFNITLPDNPNSLDLANAFTDVLIDSKGNYAGQIVAQGNGYKPSSGSLHSSFRAVFTGNYIISGTGDVTFNISHDDGYEFYIGNGASYLSGTSGSGDSSGPLTGLPFISADTGYSPNSTTVHFPGAGIYPYEIDYTECCTLGDLGVSASSNSKGTGVPPSGQLILSSAIATSQNVGQNQTFIVTATNAVGNIVANQTVQLSVNGANTLSLNGITDSNGQATFVYTGTVAGNDIVQAQAWINGMATFSNQLTPQWTGTQTTTGSGGGTNPEAQGCGASAPSYPVASPGWIGSPALHTTFSGATIPIVLASSVNLVQTCVDYWPITNPTANGIVTLISNTTSYSGGATLASLDPTLLADGSYIIRLRAKDSNGNYQDSETLITIAGEYKPGRVTFTVNDLTVPVVGLPIQIGRTYDSLNRNTVGDFGNGWNLAIGNPKLEVNPAKDVTLTLPDGTRKTFYFTPQYLSGILGFLEAPRYTPEAGQYGSLTSDGCGLFVVATNGAYVCFPGGSYQPNTYIYTDPYGRVFTIGADGKLQSVRDLNGNLLTFTPSGISSSAGLNVSFQRDGQGRITTITDTVGNAYQYHYDESGSTGDLTSIYDPGIITPTVYHYFTGSLAHYFKDDVDARGNYAARTTYYQTSDQRNGRLQSAIDALGNTTNYDYNFTNNSTIITNPDGGVTTNIFDSYGKLTQQTDPLGHITTNVYDSNHNLMSTKDPLNHTVGYGYDGKGNQTVITNALGYTNLKAYNQYGGPTVITNELGYAQTVNYDSNFNLQNLNDGLGLMGGYTWDSHGSPLSLSDGNGHSSTFQYDQYGNVLTQTDALSNATGFTYDNMGRKLTSTDPKANLTQYGYDALGHVTVITSAVGTSSQTITKYYYDGVGNRYQMTDGNNHTTTYIYDGNNRLMRTTFPDSTYITTTYDFRGNKISERDGAGHLTNYNYDQAGRLITTTVAVGTADASSSVNGYDAASRLITVTDGLSHNTINTYDAANRLTKTTDPLSHSTVFTYDARGLRTNLQDPNTNVVTYTYDVRGQQTQTSYPASYNGVIISTTQQYDLAGHVITSTDGAGNRTVYAYYTNGWLQSVKNPLLQTTSYTYDPSGNLYTLTDPNSHIITSTYTPLNQLLKKSWPDGSFETWDYDGAGNSLHHRVADGNIITTTYDILNRPQQTNYFDGRAISYSYTANGLRQLITDTAQSTTVPTIYGYDNQNRVVGVTQTNGLKVFYSYDAIGNRKTINTPAGTVTYTYYADNRLNTVTDPLTNQSSYTYDSAGNRKSLALANGITVQYNYDTLNRLTTISQAKIPASPIGVFTYTLNAANLRTDLSETVNGNSSSLHWNYDNGYKLITETRTGASAYTASYTYDNNGNRKTWTTATGTVSYNYNLLDQVISTTNGASTTNYTYDGRGNLKQAGTTTYTYNAADQLLNVNLSGRNISYLNDADGKRMQRVDGSLTLTYLWDVASPYGDIVLENHNDGTHKSWVLGGTELVSMNNSNGTYYYLHDGQGSTRALTTNSGVVLNDAGNLQVFSYDAFGNLKTQPASFTTNYLYTGQQMDSVTFLYNLRARYYNPGDGRFLSRDTADISFGNPGELNRYSYVANSPITSFDPSGLEAFGEDVLVGRVNVEGEEGLRDAFIAKAETAPLSQETIELGKDYATVARQANNTAREILKNEYGYSEEQISRKMSNVVNAYTKIEGVEYHALNSSAPREIKEIFRALYGEDKVVISSGEHAEVALRNFAAERLGIYSNNEIAQEIKVIGVSHTGGPCAESCRLPTSVLGDGFLPLSYLGRISNSFASVVEALGDIAWLL